MQGRRAAVLATTLVAWTPSALADPLPPTVLHLTQIAEKRLARDLLRVELRAEKTGADPQTVEAGINQMMAEAVSRARQAPGIETETGSYAVYHVENPSRWSGSQILMLSGSDSEAVLKLAGTLQGQGLVMSNMGSEASPQAVRSAEGALTTEALTGLERRAAAIAQQLHSAVLGYRDLSVGNAQTEGGPRPRFAAMAAGAPASMPPPIAAAGEATVSVTVSAEILLAPKQP